MELRQNIYCFALGDQWIHVETYPRGKDPVFNIFAYKQSRLSEEERWTYRWPSGGARDDKHEGINLKFDRVLVKQGAMPTCLARVCRQLHTETACLPYRWSMFSFADGEVANRFISSLLVTQQQQLTKVSSSECGLSWLEDE